MYAAYAFSKSGLVRGVLLLLLITFLTEHCCLLLLKVKDTLPPSPIPHSYGSLAYAVSGPYARTAINIALILTQFGYCTGYLIFLSRTLSDLLPVHLSTPSLVLVPLPALTALALLASIRSLGPFSLLANAALLLGVAAVVAYIIRHYHWAPASPPLADLPLFFGQMTAALEGIGLVLPVEASMQDPTQFPFVLRVALSTLVAVLMLVGVLGFSTYGADTQSIILGNFEATGTSAVVAILKSVLVVGILFTYPLQIIPVFEYCESLLLPTPAAEPEPIEEDVSTGSALLPGRDAVPEEEPLFITSLPRIAIRLTVIAATAGVAALAGRRFGLVQALVGSLGASCLAYTAPAFLHLATFRGQMGFWARAKDVAIVLFGVTGMVAGTWTTINAFLDGEEVGR